ncbi:DUF1128 domain-containing protein [Terrilactibacillus laevilacticus]|uniref:UPF0435 protein ACFSTF_06275 n=1 Tax=Terrilactibacillus laevilacticus TaxID=1380157 RepID=A0ABW5PPX9_9BACI|nr:DUF1128 domain-containing protein [Terrilactibacillus laevilacticus]
MDSQIKSRENIEKMIDVIKKKIQLVNQDLLRAEDFSIDKYDDLYDIYELINKKSSFSVSELEAILDELRGLRN